MGYAVIVPQVSNATHKAPKGDGYPSDTSCLFPFSLCASEPLILPHCTATLCIWVYWPNRQLTGLCRSQSVLSWLQIEPTSRPQRQRMCCLRLVLAVHNDGVETADVVFGTVIGARPHLRGESCSANALFPFAELTLRR